MPLKKRMAWRIECCYDSAHSNRVERGLGKHRCKSNDASQHKTVIIKDSSDRFKANAKECHPESFLLNEKCFAGKRRDIPCEVALLTCNNRQHCIEFLNWRLNSTDKDKKLEENIFICLCSEPMTSLCRIMAITCLLLLLPRRFIAGNSRTFSKYGFSCRSNGRVIDVLEQKLIILETENDQIIDKKL